MNSPVNMSLQKFLKKRDTVRNLATILVSIVFWVLVWQGVYLSGRVSPAVLASPAEITHGLPAFWKSHADDVGSTLWFSILAFLISLPVGMATGYLIGMAGRLSFSIEYGLDFIRSIPATALVPFFLIVFGVGDSTKLAVGTFSSVLVICLSTVIGLKNRSTTRSATSRFIGLTGLRRFFLVDVPESLSAVFLGCRTGVSLALVLVIVSEMQVGSNHGLGKVINDMRGSDRTPDLYTALLLTGVIGLLYNTILSRMEQLTIHWRGR